MSPIVDLKGKLAKLVEAKISWMQVSLFITLMGTFGQQIHDFGVTAAELNDSKKNYLSFQQSTKQLLELDPYVAPQGIRLARYQLGSVYQSEIQSSKTTTLATVSTVLKTLPKPPQRTAKTELSSDVNLAHLPRQTTPSPKLYRVNDFVPGSNSLTWEHTQQDSDTLPIDARQKVKRKPRIHRNTYPSLSSQPRLLLKTIRRISPTIRAHQANYGTAPSLRADQRIPPLNTIASNRLHSPKTSPKGKPANGFVFISSVFGKRPNPFGRGLEFHNGIDLVGAKGIPILATADGRVVTHKKGRGYGIHVVVDHGSGYKTLYAHLSKKRVKKNQQVKRGQIIGYLGSTGRSTGPHLHYSVYYNQQAVDPRPYIFFK